MKKSKLIEALSQLPPKEIQLFGDFVSSPFFNKNQQLKKLADVLLPRAPEFKEGYITKQKIHEAVYGVGAIYNDLKINNLTSQLLKLFYRFLSEVAFENEKANQLNLQLERLANYDLGHHSELLIKRYLREKKKKESHPIGEILHEFKLNEKLYEFQTKRQPRQFSPYLQTTNDHLDLWFVLQKLRMACKMENGNMLLQANYRCHFIDEVLAFLEFEKPHLAGEPLVKVYCSTLSMLRSYQLPSDKQDTCFFNCKKELQSHANRLSPDELYTLFHYLLNFCIKKINTGEDHYYREIFELYQLLLKGETILRNGQISQWTFRNVITSAIRLEEFDWAKIFIERYRTHLPHEEETTAVAYNLALLNLAQKDYSAALSSLFDVEFSDSFYSVSSRIIQLQCYFQLEEEQAFLALVTATQKYMQRSKLSEYHKRSNSNFLRVIKRIFQIKNNQEYLSKSDFRRKIKAIKTQLNNLEPVVNKAWLKEKLDELNMDK